jgi:hypothetical protein
VPYCYRAALEARLPPWHSRCHSAAAAAVAAFAAVGDKLPRKEAHLFEISVAYALAHQL